MNKTPNSPDSLLSEILAREFQPMYLQLEEQNLKFKFLISALQPLPERIAEIENRLEALETSQQSLVETFKPLVPALKIMLRDFLEQLQNKLNEASSSEAAEELKKELLDLINSLDNLNTSVQTMTNLQNDLHESMHSLGNKLDKVSPLNNKLKQADQSN